MLHRKYILRRVPPNKRDKTWECVLAERAINPSLSNKSAREVAEECASDIPDEVSFATKCGIFKRYIDRRMYCEDCELRPETCNLPEKGQEAHSAFIRFILAIENGGDEPVERANRTISNLRTHYGGCEECRQKFSDFDKFVDWCNDELLFSPEALEDQAVCDVLRGRTDKRTMLALDHPDIAALIKKTEVKGRLYDAAKKGKLNNIPREIEEIFCRTVDEFEQIASKKAAEEVMLDARLDAECKEKDCHDEK